LIVGVFNVVECMYQYSTTVWFYWVLVLLDCGLIVDCCCVTTTNFKLMIDDR
jgi:hypothetical protein